MNIPQFLKEKGQVIANRWQRATALEIIGVLAIALLVINSLFDVQLVVTRKPLLNKLAGTTNPTVSAVQSAPATGNDQDHHGQSGTTSTTDPALEEKVLPPDGVVLPVSWGELGKQLVSTGVIDYQKLTALYSQRGGLSPEMVKLLTDNNTGSLKITPQNASDLLNVLWALGLGNKNEVLDKGEMQDPRYGGAGRFASTGGWTLAKGDAMEHYSKHSFLKLTPAQQSLVDQVSKNIYRPCCGNSTHFPDCNHGMAMLGLLELMASQGAGEQAMYKTALAVNSYWFPDTYLTIANYAKAQGQDWSQVNPQAVLGAQFSSASGYQQIRTQTQPAASRSSGGCGV